MLMGKHLDLLKKLLKVLPEAMVNIRQWMHTGSQFTPHRPCRIASEIEQIIR